ncbi:amino acid adenylation domain-containing protein [Saccharopolyspora spinosa]|uniref:L-prolyl-[peptidyl carrier protein] synthetase n=1 Tax=Saccharopolyspora spinosa TaxID=60894 RepID=A0A2N3Y0W0_SACSN|nr:amino acid adenylation domain-containing protein [Saccharopolyspora spinosa]PKW16552.1 L-prolyl-[peptidyl carrier protein] synthetase [Saccharopolyspora spinosa]
MRGLADHLPRWAAANPAAVAVETPERSITYTELHRQSSALANALIGLGVTPGARVGLWLRKSVESVVAVYGVLKAGAAYVPVDPSAPRARAERVLADCGTACAIVHADQLDTPEGALPYPVVAVGGLLKTPHPAMTWEQATTGPRLGPQSGVKPGSLAYVIYTSGSQGRPKGVALSHRNALSFVEWAVREFGITRDDRVAGHAPFHFDLSILDIFATGLAGGRLVLIPESHVGLGGALNRVVAERRISVWYSVPNALARMLAAKNSAALTESDLRVVLFAGETFPLTQVRRLRAALPGARLYNLYGPTETNVCTFHQVRDTDLVPERAEPLPIGRPCDYAEVFVLDRDENPCVPRPGASGELCVAGASRMLGYWGDDPLTTAKTVLVSQDGGDPIPAHRTGDLVRCDDDETLTFLGRTDEMVKIRGHRVELGEVESVLAEIDGVQEVVCAAVEDHGGEKRIDAHLVVADVIEDISSLRRHCARLLPRYMIPSAFHVVPELPRTATGKIDRRGIGG